ncbi:fibronectin type III domain-containing protein [Streptomyces olivoreticuli]|uniref:fibronectin type III domain-containing protein n=1 Tax=Streptomyces olivoreticuli TaxID=68246 RepID=UPI000E22905E|nr:fibronectin type III domain-containing protein [Streptomyces olivoreticuli]
MSRKRIVLTCAAVAVGLGALAIPLTASAGSETDLSTTCRLADGATKWWATGKFALRNEGNAYAKDWKLEFELSEGQATIDNPWAFDLRQKGKHVTVTPIEDRGNIPARGERTVSVGINPSGKAVPRITGCTLGGSDSGGPEDTTPPTAPVESGSFVVDHRTVHVMWKPSTDSGSGVDKYEILQDGKLVKTVGSDLTMTNIEQLKPDTTYRFKVRAVDAAGNRSPFSKVVSLRTHPAPGDENEKPTMPKKLEGTAAGPNQVSLRWQSASDGVPVTGYRIYRDGTKVQEADGNATTATVGGLSPDTAYKFKVTAVSTSGKESDPTDEISVKTTGGGGSGGSAPSDFTAATSHKQDGNVTQHYLDLGWGVPQGHGQITTYQVYLNGKLAQTFIWGAGDAVLPIPVRTASREVLVGANPGKTYKVKIRARLGDGTWGAFSAEKTVTTGS